MLLTGAVGSGKSRLLGEVGRLAAERGIRAGYGAGSPRELAPSLSPLLEALRGCGAGLLDQARLMDLASAADPPFWLLQEIQERLEESSQHAPLVIAIDDLQWCDTVTLLALRNLPLRLAGRPIMWLITVRAEASSPVGDDTVRRLMRAGAPTIRLGSLPDLPVGEIITDLLGVPADDALTQAIGGLEGRPQLILALLRGWLDEGALVISDVARHMAELNPPARFRDLIELRLARLSAHARRAAKIGSLLGESFPADLLAVLLQERPVKLVSVLRELTSADLLIADGPGLRFRHEPVRKAVKEGVPSCLHRAIRRQAVEVRLARGTPAVELVGMLAESAEPGDKIAIRVLSEAAADVADTAPGRAAELTLRASELSGRGPERANLLAMTGHLLWQDGRLGKALTLLHSALADPAGLGTEGEALVRLGAARLASPYSFSDAVAQCRQGLELAGLSEKVRTQLLCTLALNLTLCGGTEAAAHALRLLMEAADRTGDEDLRAKAVRAESISRMYHRDQQVKPDSLRADLGLARNDPFAASEAVWITLVGAVAIEPDNALAVIDEQIGEAQAHGRPAIRRLWAMARTRALLDAGRLSEARAEADALFSAHDELSEGNLADVTIIYVLARAAIHTGDEAAYRRIKPRIQRMLDDPAQAVRSVAQWLEALRSGCVADGEPPQVTADPADDPLFIRMALHAGRRDRAETLAEICRRRGMVQRDRTVATAVAAHARGLLDDDESALRKAVDLLASVPRPLPRAAALEDLGRLLRNHDPAAAVMALNGAFTVYAEAGAGADLGRIRILLRDLGVRRRRVSAPAQKPSTRSLTPAELRVVQQVTEGATNREIADRLFLSPHTVATHIRHAFAKLGVRSRTELAQLILTDQLVPSATEVR
ncbi:LuxR family transcriptional regulator [Dactylosporangium darangshiense]|uniref:LuxR family transcriptional regulator n=2 Tax=Dactylosporangium darangshiense TaxID=579108 RepID=A0ABP8DW66_9ACTN